MMNYQGRWTHEKSRRKAVGSFSRRHSWVVLASLAVLTAGCVDEIQDPDNDDRRGRAKLIPIGQVVTDAVSPPTDGVDWKRIETPGAGFLTVNIFWDVPTIDATFMLSDKYGVTVQEIRRDRRTPSDQIIVRSEEQTFFFVKIESFDNSSVYSLQTSFANTGNGLDGSDEPIPELVSFSAPPEPEEEEAAEGGDSGGGAAPAGDGPALPEGGAAAAADTKKAPAAAAADPVSAPEPAAAGVQIEDLVPDYTGKFDTLEAQILRVIPKALGGSEITIDSGTNNGVDVNFVGEIVMADGNRLEGGRFKVTEVYKNTLLAQTNAPANQVSAAAKVTIKIPKEQ